MEQIIVTVSVEGEVKVEVKGHAGPGCKALSKEIEQSLGETIIDEPTRELHETTQTRVRAEHRS